MSKDYEGRIVCTECHSDNVLKAEGNQWIVQGLMPPCKFCGGVTEYIDTEDERERNDFLNRSDRRRGLGK